MKKVLRRYTGNGVIFTTGQDDKKGRISVTISDNIIIGESIAYRADSILQSIREQKPCGYPV